MLNEGNSKDVLKAMEGKKIIEVIPQESKVFFVLEDKSRVEIYMHCYGDCFLDAEYQKEG